MGPVGGGLDPCPSPALLKLPDEILEGYPDRIAEVKKVE